MNIYEITIYYKQTTEVHKCEAPTFEFANKKFAKYLRDPNILSLKVERFDR